jgi:hypothetical protein
MKLKVRITESQLEELRNKYTSLKSTNEEEGKYGKDDKNPYMKKGFIFIKLDSNKSVPNDSYYFSEEDATDLNKMGHELESLKVAYEEKLKSLVGSKKNTKKD